MSTLVRTNVSLATPAKEHATPPIILPFALIGLVGGGLTGSITHQFELIAAFAVVTMASAAVLGGFVAHHERTRGHVSATRLFCLTTFAGCINGALLIVPFVFPIGSLVGAIVGLFFAVPFVPAFMLVLHWARETGSAREGSLVDRAQRRGPLSAAAASIALATLFALVGRWQAADLAVLRACAAFAAAVAAIVVVLDVFAHAVARRAAHAHVQATGPLHLELGVGDDVTIEQPPAIPYRAPSTQLRICGGDPYVATVHLRKQLMRHSLALAITLASIAVHVTQYRAAPSEICAWSAYGYRWSRYCAAFSMSFRS